MKQNKKTMWAVAIIIVVIIIALSINRASHKSAPAADAGSEVPLVTSPAVTPSRTRAPQAKEAMPVVDHDYDKSLIAFRDKRVQFGEDCSASPMKSVFAVGEKIMLDNRSDEQRGFTVGTQTISIPRYDFAIVTLSEKGDFGVDCGAFKNAATIVVQ